MASKSHSECPTCSERFGSEYGMKQHHAKSHGESLSTTEYQCDECGKTFTGNVNNDRKFCSIECKAKVQSREYTGKDHPNHAKIKRICPTCQESFQTIPSRNERRTYCSNDCRGEAYSSMYRGDDNPFWKGGTEYWRSGIYSELRKRIIERDGGICQGCGSENGLQIHHIIPLHIFSERFDDLDDSRGEGMDPHTDSNLITLCSDCHDRVHKWGWN